MKKPFIAILLTSFAMFCFMGCSRTETSGDEAIARQYVKDQGYKVTARRGELTRYTLDKSMLRVTGAHVNEWRVQKTQPDLFLGKDIVIYGFTVSNHPLSNLYQTDIGVYIMLSEGKVIGGYSAPDKDRNGAIFTGGSYSFKGETLEEVTGKSYNEWVEDWSKKYGSNTP